MVTKFGGQSFSDAPSLFLLLHLYFCDLAKALWVNAWSIGMILYSFIIEPSRVDELAAQGEHRIARMFGVLPAADCITRTRL